MKEDFGVDSLLIALNVRIPVGVLRLYSAHMGNTGRRMLYQNTAVQCFLATYDLPHRGVFRTGAVPKIGVNRGRHEPRPYGRGWFGCGAGSVAGLVRSDEARNPSGFE